MDRYVDGDPQAFSALHGALSPRLRGFLMKLVRDDATVDDLIQLTFLKAHLARERFTLRGDDPDGSVQGWYFAIARNVALDHLRQRGRRERRRVDLEASPNAELPDDTGTIEEAIGERERAEEIVARVREAIAALPQGQREVVELHKLRGMSMAEVAERLQIREGAARVRAHRGYKTLARILGAGTPAFLGLHAPASAHNLEFSPDMQRALELLHTIASHWGGGPS
ncbi:RNA polymerase sigma factor [Pseudenhygromyxa sp. WMMC2535]|uniref:RNA polymerase sigma factor n=1 Tax=Pseudenhygromyxa sp. WMMC2535 TaxID=2712867 RepID=UPI0015570CA5|nr:RNA polymerase sigma factor [Pseudenhygromyxa sp. WMMC2535]NVB41566.1 RNA polymerase sigma factor [Pseudenhygromyxa sp. WMMC2535]